MKWMTFTTKCEKAYLDTVPNYFTITGFSPRASHAVVFQIFWLQFWFVRDTLKGSCISQFHFVWMSFKKRFFHCTAWSLSYWYSILLFIFISSICFPTIATTRICPTAIQPPLCIVCKAYSLRESESNTEIFGFTLHLEVISLGFHCPFYSSLPFS